MMTPRDFLAQRMPGPYTCLRARDRSLLGFDFHLARLLHSIRWVFVCDMHGMGDAWQIDFTPLIFDPWHCS